MVSLICLLTEVEQEFSSSVAMVAQYEVLCNDFRCELIAVSQVAGIFTIFFSITVVTKVFQGGICLRFELLYDFLSFGNL